MRRPRPLDSRAARVGAQQQLRRFRQGTALAVALTALLFMAWGVPLELEGQAADQAATAEAEGQNVTAPAGPSDAVQQATTTVWEAGGAGKPVGAAQATGALITVPNWEVLRSNIINYTRDFPYVWDEIRTSVANESDLGYAAKVIEETARQLMGDEMQDAVQRYERLLRAERLDFSVEEVPRVYLSGEESWTDCTLRYLVPVRSRRHWSSLLTLEISRALARPEHAGRILPVYTRREIRVHEEWPAVDRQEPAP